MNTNPKQNRAGAISKACGFWNDKTARVWFVNAGLFILVAAIVIGSLTRGILLMRHQRTEQTNFSSEVYDSPRELLRGDAQ